MPELPTMMAMNYTSNTAGLEEVMAKIEAQRWQGNPLRSPAFNAAFTQTITPQPQPKEIALATTRRIVKVFVADPNENVPVDKCLLIQGEEKLTELTDQELFFELDIKAALEKHNAYRVTVRNKAVKEREEFLEPARIRDLKMTVVTIAQF